MPKNFEFFVNKINYTITKNNVYSNYSSYLICLFFTKEINKVIFSYLLNFERLFVVGSNKLLAKNFNCFVIETFTVFCEVVAQANVVCFTHKPFVRV